MRSMSGDALETSGGALGAPTTPPARDLLVRFHRPGRNWSRRLCLALLVGATAIIGSGLTLDLLSGPSASAWAGPGDGGVGDSDGDGIPDLAENEYTGTAPDRFDSDGDGYGDGLEHAAGSDPTNFDSKPVESSGVRILVAPDDESVYVVFLIASQSQFEACTRRKALFVAYAESGNVVAATALFLGDSAAPNVTMFESLSGNVRSWTLKVNRQDIGLWSVGLGMREHQFAYCDGLLVNRRSNDCVYQIRFENDLHGDSHAEPTEPEGGRSPNPGQGFKECEQISFSRAGSPLRHILSERCETREHYICPADCGALQGQTVIDLKKVWLY